MSTKLETCVTDLVTVFHTYSRKEGDRYTLTKAELKQMLQEQLSELLAGCKNTEEVDKILTDLDSNSDGVVDFQEFLVFVAMLTILCHEFFKECDQESNRSGGKSGKN